MGGVTPQLSDRKPGVHGGQQQPTQASPEQKPVTAPVPHPPATGARKASSSSSTRSSTASLRAPHVEREPDQKVSPSSTSTSGSSHPADAQHMRPIENLEREPTMYAEKTNSESDEAPEGKGDKRERERQRQPEGGDGEERESPEEGAAEPKRESEGGAVGGGEAEDERVLVSRGKRFHALREGELRASPRDDEDDEDDEEREAEGAESFAPAEAEGEQQPPAEEVGDEQRVEEEPSAEAEGGEKGAEEEEAKRARKERQQRLLKLRLRRVRSAAIGGGLRPPVRIYMIYSRNSIFRK